MTNRKFYSLLAGLLSLKLFLHFLTNTRYGLHRDAYLYLSYAEHPGWGYMEGPPFMAVLSVLSYWLGGSDFAVRLFPALAGCVILCAMAYLIRRLGGGVWALFIASTAFLFAPAYLRGNTLFQPVSFNQMWWTLLAIQVSLLVHTGRRRHWYWAGGIFGLGLLTKYSIAFYGLALLVPVLILRWQNLGSKHLYLAAALALLLFSPNLLWQVQHDWPLLAHMEELRRTQLVNVSLGRFLLMQPLMLFGGMVTALAGLIYSFRQKASSVLGIAYLITLALLLLLSGKPYYLLGAYPALFVLGGLALERGLRQKAARRAYVIASAVLSLVLLPYSLPVLSLPQMEKYSAYMDRTLGLSAPLIWEDGQRYTIPQDYADMHGWDEMAERVAKVYHSLPDSLQENCLLLGGSYGHAGTINHHRKRLQLRS